MHLTAFYSRPLSPRSFWPVAGMALASSNTGSPRLTDFPSNLANLIGWEYEKNILRILRRIVSSGDENDCVCACRLRPCTCTHVSRHFWIRNFFSPDSEIFPSTRNVAVGSVVHKWTEAVSGQKRLRIQKYPETFEIQPLNSLLRRRS